MYLARGVVNKNIGASKKSLFSDKLESNPNRNTLVDIIKMFAITMERGVKPNAFENTIHHDIMSGLHAP